MKKKLIVANWKMNGDFAQGENWAYSFLDLASKKTELFENVEAVACPAVIFIDEFSANILDYSFEKADSSLARQGKVGGDIEKPEVIEAIEKFRNLKVGAQDCHAKDSGSFTGDVSAKMIASLGCEYVIVGHSERRASHYETNEVVSSKVRAVVDQNMSPILCVGESKEIRDLSKHTDFVKKQLIASIPSDVEIDHLVVAYEPIWAIGTGVVPNISQIQEMTNLVKAVLDNNFSDKVQSYAILYGGSVNVGNAKEILSVENLDGLLVGKASLNANDFFEICVKAAG